MSKQIKLKTKKRKFTKEKIKLSIKDEQLEWRRSKVIEMRARGMSQTEIARELQVSKASISLDM